MELNYWMYYDKSTRQKTAAELVSFGLEILKSAKLISEIDRLNDLKKECDAGNQDMEGLSEFAFSYLIDCIRISIFFENYMKAELIANGYCVHEIQRDDKRFKVLAKKQKANPISIVEISESFPFEINFDKSFMSHPSLRDTTIGLSILLQSEYQKYYELDETIISFINEIKSTRNTLHFYSNINFGLSEKLINSIEAVDEFANHIISDRLKN